VPDLASFKECQRSFGTVGDRLCRPLPFGCVRTRDTDNRITLGGDEFAIIHPARTTGRRHALRAERLVARLAEAFDYRSPSGRRSGSASHCMRPATGEIRILR